MKKLLLSLGLVCIFVFAGVMLASAGQEKSDVCHITGTFDFGDGEVPIGHVINIADPALPAHVAHGDPEAFELVQLPDGTIVCVGVPVTCPETLVLGPTNHWFETYPPFAWVSEIRMVLVLRNEDPFGRELTFSEDTFQLWSVPSGIVPPVVITDEPSGVVPFDSLFTYDLTIDVSSLPSADDVLAFRPKSYTSGTMPPSWAPVVEVAFTCQ
ncbi:MAG: hypothetical protein KJ065_27275 [Anaerolineae bacterium]|nr:hypothetical protein [Anaerolineae bacterium]